MMPEKSKNIFVTGGAGYVGSALVPNLLEKGYHVTVYDLYIYNYKFQTHPNLKQIKGDIRDKEKLKRAIKGSDVLIHLACISNDPSYELNPKLSKDINYNGFKNIIDGCKQENVKRLIFASSASVYGVKPIDMEVTEDTEPEPITDYSKYKIECENLLLNTDMEGTEYVIVRPSTLCGYAPRLRLDLAINILTINALVNKKIKIFGGSQMRPNLNIKDIVRCYALMLITPKEKIDKQIFNVVCQNNTIKELADIVKKVADDESIEFEVVPTQDIRSYHVNSDKINKLLGFECLYSIEDSIKSLIEAYNAGLIIDGLNNPLYHNIKRMQEIDLK